MKRGNGDGKRRWHVVGGFGEPDDDCPICRAHGIDPKSGLPVVLPITVEEILRCPCPMCANARLEPLDD